VARIIATITGIGPGTGFAFAHAFRIFLVHVADYLDKYNDTRTEYIATLPSIRLRWLNNTIWCPVTLAWCCLSADGSLIWGFCMSTMLLVHDTFTINSLSHLFARGATKPVTPARTTAARVAHARRSWHNNHHHFNGPARQASSGGRSTSLLHAESLSWFESSGTCANSHSSLTQDRLRLKTNLRKYLDRQNVLPLFIVGLGAATTFVSPGHPAWPIHPPAFQEFPSAECGISRLDFHLLPIAMTR